MKKDLIINESFKESIINLERNFTDLYKCIDLERLPLSLEFIQNIESEFSDFESNESGGRGDVYRLAQKNLMVREIGIKNLFSYISKDLNFSQEIKILDALGGDGLLTKVISNMVSPDNMPQILTTDISKDMVNAAILNKLPAIRQAAQFSAIKDNVLDGVILAYGTHHIPINQRLIACKEAFRCLKKGGDFVLHDFESNSPVSKWFKEVVHKYSLTGHDFPHFDRDEIAYYLTKCDFESFIVEHVYDPFIFIGPTKEDVKLQFTSYLLNMYGLYKLENKYTGAELHNNIYELALEYFQYDYEKLNLDKSFGIEKIDLEKFGDIWKLEMPRVSIVGHGKK